MVVLVGTNIAVDEFTLPRSNPLAGNFVYFLTHWHADHYWGLKSSWRYGPIYCSQVTRKLLLSKFPKLEEVTHGLELDVQHSIVLSHQKAIKVSVRLFDSNHMAGSVMLLFEGYFGRVLHTGDMRFHITMAERTPYLFPNLNREYRKCSLPIDEVILDNTYCDPIFKFPKRSRAVRLLCSIIDTHLDRRILLATDSIGKEQVFVTIARHYRTPILLNKERFTYAKCMNIDLSLFTRERHNAWIQVVKKGQIPNRLRDDPRAIAITLTGWANIDNYHAYDDRNFIVPYSLHSNYSQLQDFARVVKMASLKEVVKHQKGGKTVRNIKRFQGYVNTVSHLHQRGMQFFQKEYVDATLMSASHRRILEDSSYLDSILADLGVHPKLSKPQGEVLLDRSLDESKEQSSSDEQPPFELLRAIEEENRN